MGDVVKQVDFDAHLRADPKTVHSIWQMIVDNTALKVRAHFRAYVNSAQDNLTANTWTKMAADAETFDNGGVYDSATNYRFTAPVAGYYHFDAHVEFDTGIGSSNTYEICFRKNNAEIANHKVANNADGDQVALMLSDTRYLAAGDYIEVWIKANNVSTADVANATAQSWFSGFIISV